MQEEKFYMGSGESFGKQWAVGDCVGVLLDLIDRTLSKFILMQNLAIFSAGFN